MKEVDKERVVVEVVQRVLDQHGKNPQAIEEALFDTIYQEKRRLERERDKAKAKSQGEFYRHTYQEAIKTSPERQRELLKAILQNFASEVVGHFDPRVYELATKAIPLALSVLLNTISPIRLLETVQGSAPLVEQFQIEGETDALRNVAKMGTTILVPTHSSNMDSILIGFALYRLGLPPYTYGAGLNLFSNKLIGFFMHNLGAYKVDRRKKALVYKDVLKTYAGCTMELGYHNLFFPGGTRSRSGSVEQKLKLGLLGMGLNAYINNLKAKKERPDIFIVPATINYQLVLEAETLIDDYLKEVGKSRYIIEDDEFSKPKRILDFMGKVFSMHSRIHMIISKPLDVFGNLVDADGVSRDSRDRPVDRTKYVSQDGKPTFDPQRDAEYTRELSHSVVEAFSRDTVIKSTNLVSHAVFNMLKGNSPQMDLYRLLRTGGSEESFSLPDTYRRVNEELETLRNLESEGRIRLDETTKNKDTVAVVSEALAHLNCYHRKPALERRGDRLFHVDRNLLLYYQNRLAGLGFERLERTS